MVQVKPLTDSRQRNKRNGSCLISATASSWIRNRINTALLKKGKGRKTGNPLKDSGGFLEQRTSYHVEEEFLHTCLDLTGLMLCFGLFCTIALSWTIPSAGVQTGQLFAWSAASLNVFRVAWKMPASAQFPAALQLLLTTNLLVPAQDSHKLLCFAFNQYSNIGTYREQQWGWSLLFQQNSTK